jgi:hypothetical protein
VHRQSRLCRVLCLGHLAKRFAECQGALGKEKQPLWRRVTETKSLPSVPGDTRQRSSLCRVSARRHWTKNKSLSSATWDTRQRTRQRGSPCQVLCRVLVTALSKRMILCRVSETLHSAKNLYRCPGLGSLPSAVLDTPQSTSLLSVTLVKVTSRNLFYLFFIFHPNKQKISHIHHIYHIYTSQISSQTYIANANINIHHKLKCSTRVSNTNISLIRLKL